MTNTLTAAESATDSTLLSTATIDPTGESAEPATEFPEIDPALGEAFAGRVITDFAGAAATAMTLIGDRLGLFEAMTGAGALTASELAARTGLQPRLVREWLAAQVVSGA